MYTSIRTAKAAPGKASEVAGQIEQSFLPVLSSLPGFIGYYVVTTADDTIATVSIFQNQASAEESNRKAQDWVKQHVAELMITPLNFVTGEVFVNKTA